MNVKTSAIILNGQHRTLTVVGKLNTKSLCLRVMRYVLNRLLSNAIDSLFHVWAERRHGGFQIKFEVEMKARSGRFGRALDGEYKSHVLKSRWSQCFQSAAGFVHACMGRF